MRDRDQRLRWIEKLFGTSRQETERNNALVVPSAEGDVAIAFSFIVEVVPASRVKPFALLPERFCGVVCHGSELAPVIDAEEHDTATGHVVLARGAGCLLGIRLNGTPSVVDLDAISHVAMGAEERPTLPAGVLPLLDVDAVAEALLALD